MGENREAQRIADQFKRSFEGPAWHGPALMELLRKIPVDVAPAKPLEHAHSIWEIVLHIRAWQDAVLARLNGGRANLTAAQDWPEVADYSEAAWRQTLAELEASYKKLHAAIAATGDQRLDEILDDKDYSVYVLLHGVVQHDLYHAGQIAVLMKSSR